VYCPQLNDTRPSRHREVFAYQGFATVYAPLLIIGNTAILVNSDSVDTRIVARTRSCDLEMSALRGSLHNDLMRWVLRPTVADCVGKLAFLAAVLSFAFSVYGKTDPDLIRYGFGPISGLPFRVQVVLGLIRGSTAGAVPMPPSLDTGISLD